MCSGIFYLLKGPFRDNIHECIEKVGLCNLSKNRESKSVKNSLDFFTNCNSIKIDTCAFVRTKFNMSFDQKMCEQMQYKMY